MKTKIKNLFLLPALIAVLNLLPAGRVTAQRLTTLYSFTAAPYNGSCCDTNSDGAQPYAGLVLPGNTLYGTAYLGGFWNRGTVFSLSFPPPQLTISPSGANVILTWPANVAGFDYTGYTLQSTTNRFSRRPGSAILARSSSPAITPSPIPSPRRRSFTV